MKKEIDLKQWIIDFIKFKDAFTKSITNISEKDNEVLVTYKDKEVRYIISPELSDALKELQNSHIVIVTLNKKSNLNTLIQNWHTLAGYNELILYFINPNSLTEKKWVIRPHLHDKVADDDVIRPGLESIFSTVDEI